MHTLIPTWSSEEIKDNTNHQTEWERHGKWWCQNRKCYNKYVVGLFCSHSKTVWKTYSRETTYPPKNIRFMRHVLRCVLSFEMQRYVNDSCLPHFSLYVRQEICIRGCNLSVMLLFTSNYKCYSTCSRNKHIPKSFNWFISSVEFGSRFKNNLLQARLWHVHHLRGTWGC